MTAWFMLGFLLWTTAGGQYDEIHSGDEETIQGVSSPSRFIQTNTNLLLTVIKTELVEDEIFFWKFDNNNIIAYSDRIIIDDNYKDRVEFFPQNNSLILKNVQLNDSGIYTADVLGWTDLRLATYEVIVQAPVCPVLLSVDSVSFSSDSCNFTVSCSTEHFSISRSVTCNNLTCEQPRPLTSDPAPAPLHLHLSHVAIICNHSNHVSWTLDTKYTHHVCPFESGGRWCGLKTWVFSVGLLLMASAFITVHVLECVGKKNN